LGAHTAIADLILELTLRESSVKQTSKISCVMKMGQARLQCYYIHLLQFTQHSVEGNSAV